MYTCNLIHVRTVTHIIRRVILRKQTHLYQICVSVTDFTLFSMEAHFHPSKKISLRLLRHFFSELRDINQKFWEKSLNCELVRIDSIVLFVIFSRLVYTNQKLIKQLVVLTNLQDLCSDSRQIDCFDSSLLYFSAVVLTDLRRTWTDSP